MLGVLAVPRSVLENKSLYVQLLLGYLTMPSNEMRTMITFITVLIYQYQHQQVIQLFSLYDFHSSGKIRDQEIGKEAYTSVQITNDGEIVYDSGFAPHRIERRCVLTLKFHRTRRIR